MYKWRYVSAANPLERLLTLKYEGPMYCYSIDRPHKSQNCTVVIDLRTGNVWQKCWDAECTLAVRVANREVTLRKKKYLIRIPPDNRPSEEELAAFELERNAARQRAAEQSTRAEAAASHVGEARPDSGPGGAG